MCKPLSFVDLDDTLFQTMRKMAQQELNHPIRTGAFDRDHQSRSFMNQEQAHFVDWLLKSTHCIPVTARGTEEISRVNIPFQSWKITTHGAVILTPKGDPDEEWKQDITTQLMPYQFELAQRQQALTEAFKQAGAKAWARMNYEYGETAVYLVAKHTNSTKISELYRIASQVDERLGLDGMYVHRNDNNIAWLPNCIEKGLATSFLISKLRQSLPHVPIFGLGDSLSDHRFLQHCSWFGMPQKSQLSEVLSQSLGDV